MKAGQKLTNWWAKLVGGGFATPQQLVREAYLEDASLGETKTRFFGAPADTEAFTAPKRLQAPAFMKSNAFLTQWNRADYQFTDRRLMRWSAQFIELARARGIPLYTHCAFRTREEQERLRAQGFSKASWPNGAHNIGEAVDIVHGVHHWEMTTQEWYYLYTLGKEALRRVNAKLPKGQKLALNWGGDDQTSTDTFRWDPAHWEIIDYRKRIRRISAGPRVHHTPRGILRYIQV